MTVQCSMNFMEHPFRCAVIGLGVGEQHAIGYAHHPACKLMTLCDVNPSKLREVGARFPGVSLVTDSETVLTDPEIDVVSIATYDDSHAEQVLVALEHGKHVFVEKPLCTQIDEARRIRAALGAHPELRLSTNTMLRASARFRWVKEQCEAGTFGDLFCVEADYNYGRLWKVTEGWRGQLPFYSAVYGGGIHVVDLLRWLTGDEVVEVAAYGNAIASRGSQFRYRDCIVATLKFQSGIVGKISVNYGCVRPHFHPVSIYGTKATFMNDLPHGRLYTSRDPDAPFQSVEDPYPGVQKWELLKSFLGAIHEGRDPIITEDEIFRTMAVCFAIEQSADRVQPVDVKEIEAQIGSTFQDRFGAVA